jgi:hypothetical protein
MSKTRESVSADQLLARPVRYRGIGLGTPVRLAVDRERTRILGLEVLGPDGTLRFLPWGALTLGGDQLEVESPAVLLDTGEAGFYESIGVLLEGPSGVLVGRGGELVSHPEGGGIGPGP